MNVILSIQSLAAAGRYQHASGGLFRWLLRLKFGSDPTRFENRECQCKQIFSIGGSGVEVGWGWRCCKFQIGRHECLF